MWLGLGHLSVKKALCLGISFQKQVVNPDVTFHKEQNTIKNLPLPLSPVDTKGKKKELFLFITKIHLQFGHGYALKEISKPSAFLFWSYLVSINFPWEHKGEYNKEHKSCGYYSQQQHSLLFYVIALNREYTNLSDFQKCQIYINCKTKIT